MNRTFEERFLNQIDISYSYQLAKRMEEYCSNPELGFRTAGSKAEFETGEMLAREMDRIGLKEIRKDPIQIDSWEFHKAELYYINTYGARVKVILGAYQTTFVTNGPKEFPLVYAGKGTMADYEHLDVKNKIVLVEINQRDEWWISYPVYQAHLKGATAVIAIQAGGYGEADEAALNAQDIAGPADAPALSISRKDAKELIHTLEENPNLCVELDVDSRVMNNQKTYNITGRIPGKNPNRMILMSAHYDSYFHGFQDDNTAVAMMFGIAKTLMEINYQPENTVIICAMAAEEWGVEDSPFDWSTGAYEEVFHAHPDWRGHVVADLNFELPAVAHGSRDRIRSTYEYQDFLEEFLKKLPELTDAYPQETQITAPIETWSDDFSIAIAGIPSMVNDFTCGSFMATNYHSQYDDDSSYDAEVYRMHHELYGLLLMAIDHTKVVPLDFSRVFQKSASSVDLNCCNAVRVDGNRLVQLMENTAELAEQVYQKVKQINQSEGKEADGMEETLLQIFQKVQDMFVRIDWYGNVCMPQETYQKNLELLSEAQKDLEQGRVSSALRKLYQINNNRYAFMFEEKVYQHFSEYSLAQPKSRLKWGYKRIVGYVNLYHEVRSLIDKEKADQHDYKEEIEFLGKVKDKQLQEYQQCLNMLEIGTMDIMRQLQKLIQ